MDPIEEWTNAQHRVTGLTGDLSSGEAAETVPACPEWTVRDLLAHMIGLNADVLAGDEPDDHNEAWTQRQVDRRANRPVVELLEEWAGLVEPMRRWMREHTSRPLADILIHEQDLRGALRVPGGRATPGLASLRDDFAGRFGAAVADEPPILLDGGIWRWVSRGPAEDAATVVRADEFELTRAVMSRRSAAQLRWWTAKGDVEPYLAGFATLGDLPDRDLEE